MVSLQYAGDAIGRVCKDNFIAVFYHMLLEGATIETPS